MQDRRKEKASEKEIYVEKINPRVNNKETALPVAPGMKMDDDDDCFVSKSINKWFSDEPFEDKSNSSESEAEDNESWEGQVQRRRRNKERRKRNLFNRKKKQRNSPVTEAFD